MYSAGGGDARATLPPNSRDSSSSMPIDHASAWQREPYNRDVRIERGDRDRIIGGKREWNSDRPSSGAPFQRAFGLHSVNGNLGPPNKRRLQGRHSGFHTENGRYNGATNRADPSPFGSIPPLENGLARKFDRDAFYSGSECPGVNTGFSNGPITDHRSKDLDDRRKRESYLSGEGRDVGSSAVTDQPARPYHSQVLSEVENSSWERDRSKGVINSTNWESSQRSEREHRDRLAGKPDLYSRREGKFSQFDAGRDWTQADKELEGSRLDRYGSSSRDCFSGDILGGKDSILGCDWRRRERSISVSASRTSAFAVSNGSSKDSSFRPQGLDVPGSLSPPQLSPNSTPSSTVHDPVRDDGSHPSPPKRPRLGWGQGLAKYEKKKVVETDESTTNASGGVVSGYERGIVSACPSGTTCEVRITQDMVAAEESPVSVVSKPTASVTSVPSATPQQQPLESVCKSSIDFQSTEQDTAGKHEAEGAFTVSSNLPVVLENGIIKGDACSVSESVPDVSIRQIDPLESIERQSSAKELVSCQLPLSEPSAVEQSCASEVVRELLPDGDLAGWTKEAILQRVDKVEFEIEQVEREIAKLENQDSVEALGAFSGSDPLDGSAKEILAVKAEQIDDGPEAMDEDALELPALGDDGGDSTQQHTSPCRSFLPVVESVSKSPATHTEGGVMDVEPLSFEEKAVSNEGVERCQTDHVTLEEGELKEDLDEEAISNSFVEDSQDSLLSSLAIDPDSPQLIRDGRLVSVQNLDDEHQDELTCRMVLQDFQGLASALTEENKKQAHLASDSFLHLLAQNVPQGMRGKLYSCPAEAPVWEDNVESHNANYERLLEKITEKNQLLKFSEQILTMRFRALKDAWRQEQLGIPQQQRGTKPVRRWEIERRNGTAPLCQRSSLRLRPVQSGTGKLEALSEEVMKKLMLEPPMERLRTVLKMPAMILGEKDRVARRFDSKNALVEDPVLIDTERKMINPWSPEEKKVFLEKFAHYNKNFSKISSHLEYKTTADCVEFYYRNQKSEDFEKIRRRQQLKKRRDYAKGSYLATSLQTSSRQREANAHARAEALNVQTAAAAAVASPISVGAKAVRSSTHHKPVDRVRMGSSLDPASLPAPLEFGKSLSGKESKPAVANASFPICANAGTLAAIGTSASLLALPSSLSSAAPSIAKLNRERSSIKTTSGAGPSATRSGSLELHISGSKGTRTMHVRRDLAKSAGEEADAQWTDRERELFTDAVSMFGKDFQHIADHIGSKSQGQCKSFFSKTRKRLGLDQLVEQYHASLKTSPEAVVPVQNSEITDVQMEEVVKPAVSENVQVTSTGAGLVSTPVEETLEVEDDRIEEGADAVQVQEIKTEELVDPPVVQLTLKEDSVENLEELPENPVDGAAAVVETEVVTEAVTVVETEVVTEAVTVDEGIEEQLEALNIASVKSESLHEQSPSPVPKIEEADELPLRSESTGVAVSGVLKEDDNSDAVKGAVNGDNSPKTDMVSAINRATVASVNFSDLLADQLEPKLSPSVVVKPEPGSPQLANSASTDSAFLPPMAASMSHPTSALFSTMASNHISQQTREKGGRVGSGETKPRREPTSWTQEEKEKFADIIRNHGKDWTRLHDCLPAKSLTQIKTYFQNSKAKLGLLTPEGLSITGGRGVGSRKRKADDSDTSSNNVGSMASVNELKPGVIPSDVDVAPQKVNPVMAALPNMTAPMSMGAPPVGMDNLAYALFSQRMSQAIDQDPMTVQKFIRQMCSSNGFAQNNPTGLYPFLHQQGLPMFSTSGLQRTPHSNLQQQLAASLSQKSSQSMVHQQPLQPPGALQQSSQPTVHQQTAHQLQTAQVVARNHLSQNMMQHQAAAQLQQQHQTSKAVIHPQVVVLQQGQAVQRQQQQQIICQQVHHPQAQQAASQQQQGGSPQHVGNQPLPVSNSPQVANQFKQLHHQQQVLLQQQQQQQYQQAVQQLQHQQLQQQQQQQQQQQEQAHAHVQAQVQVQAHGHMHQHQNSQTPLLQPLAGSKPKIHQTLMIQPLPQQLTKALSTPALQQGSSLHRHEQLQHGQTLALHRGNTQTAVSSNSGDGQGHHVEMGEARGSNSNRGATMLREFSRADLQQQLSAAVLRATPSQPQAQQQAIPQRPTPTPVSESPQIRPGDVKLFGQSLLCQPTSSAAMQTGLRLSGSSNDRVSVQQSPVYSTSSTTAVSMAIPTATLPKVYGKDSVPASSAFRGVPFMLPDGRQAAWPTLASQTGNMGLWNIMSGLQSQGVSSKPTEGESELQSMQEVMTRMSREARELETEQAILGPTHKVQQVDQPRGVQELCRNEGLSNVVHGLDKPHASVIDQVGGPGTSVLTAADADRRNDNLTHVTSGSDRASMIASRNSRSQLESFPIQTAGPLPNSQQVPRTVINALMAIADWQQSRSLQSQSTNIGSPRLEDLQAWEIFFRQNLAANSGSMDALKATSSLGLAATLSASHPHLSGPELLQQCVRDNGMYFTPQHVPNLAGHAGVSSSAWNSGASLLHPSDAQRILVNPALASFHPSALSRAPTATEEHLGSADSRDPDNGSGGVG